MAETLALLRDYVKDELGDDIVGLLGANVDSDIRRYLNEGQRRLGWYSEGYSTLTWDAGDVDVALPANFAEITQIEVDSGVQIGRHVFWGTNLYFTEPGGSTGSGTARIFYLAHVSDLSADADSTVLPELGDAALVAFACYRAYHRIASSRALYTRYSTVTQTNGVELQDITLLADRYYTEYVDAKDNLPLRQTATFYGE